MSGKGSTTQQQQTYNSPFSPTIQPLSDLTNQIANSNAPSYAPQATTLANSLTSNQPDYNAAAQASLNQYQNYLTPFTQSSYLDPMSNPYLGPALQTLNGDITNQIKDQFAAAGRSGSGLENQNLARGLSQGLAQLLLSQYNTNVGVSNNAAQNLYGAQNTTNQGILGNTLTGIQVGQQIPGLTDNIAAKEGLLLPIAGAGGSSSGYSQGSYTQPWSQTFNQVASPFRFSWGGTPQQG